MRGKADDFSTVNYNNGITPAYAGKSFFERYYLDLH